MKINSKDIKKVLENHQEWLADSKKGSFANLSDANLSGANLSDANLWGANLWGANLWGANGNLKEVKSMKIETYSISYTKDILQIGCENHSIKEWFKFDDNKIMEMGGKEALYFWRKWKSILMQIMELSK